MVSVPSGVGSGWGYNSKGTFFQGIWQSEERSREFLQKRKLKGFGILLLTELRVLSGSLELYTVETHRTILNQKGKYFSVVVAG